MLINATKIIVKTEKKYNFCQNFALLCDINLWRYCVKMETENMFLTDKMCVRSREERGNVLTRCPACEYASSSSSKARPTPSSSQAERRRALPNTAHSLRNRSWWDACVISTATFGYGSENRAKSTFNNYLPFEMRAQTKTLGLI